MLLLVNGGLALLQIGLAPLAAVNYRHPQIAQLLRAQALIFLATPFISIPEVLLMRQMNFRRQALVNLAATLVSAGVALGCALGGLGVWTLVWAPIALFWTRPLGLQLVTPWSCLAWFGDGAGRDTPLLHNGICRARCRRDIIAAPFRCSDGGRPGVTR